MMRHAAGTACRRVRLNSNVRRHPMHTCARNLIAQGIFACTALRPYCASAQYDAPISCTSPKTTLEINECAMREYKGRDRELNEAFKALNASLKPESDGDTTDYNAVKIQLVAAQRAWVNFRDADCLALRKFYEEGTIRTAMQLGCLIERTARWSVQSTPD